MNTVWVVILVTAVSPFNYTVTPLIDADTVEQCHQKAVVCRSQNRSAKKIRKWSA